MKTEERKHRKTQILPINLDIRTREEGVRGEKGTALPPNGECNSIFGLVDGDYFFDDIYISVGTL